MAETTETLLSKKLDRSDWNSTKNVDNFKEDKELTVEITIAEYRDLIRNNTKSDYEISKIKIENSELKEKNKELLNRVEHLESVLKEIKYCKNYEEKEIEREEE